MKVYRKYSYNMKKVFGYCRVSTIGQMKDGDSIETQKYRIAEYCKTKNLDLVQIYDEQESGALPPRNRTKMGLLLSRLDNKEADGLVITKIDRVSRSVKDFVILVDEFKDKHLDFHCIDANLDNTTPHGEFTMNLLASLAQLERSLTIIRTTEVLNHKKAKGERVGTIPFGKRMVKDSRTQMEDDPEEQQTILMAKELRTIQENGKPMGYKKISEELIKRSRKNKEGNPNWYPSQIGTLLGKKKRYVKKKKASDKNNTQPN